VDHLGEVGVQRIPGLDLAERELAKAENDGQHVVEVVGHAPGELPNGIHLL